jgi:hypothetical protein
MSLAHALTPYTDRTPGAGPDRPDSVKRGLTSKRRKPHVENGEYAAFARRVLRAYSRRIAGLRLHITRQAAQQRWGSQ